MHERNPPRVAKSTVCGRWVCHGLEETGDPAIESCFSGNAMESRIRGCREDCAGESHSVGYYEGCPGDHDPENGSRDEETGSAGAGTSGYPPDCANRVGCEPPRSHGVVIHAVTSVCPLGCETAAPRL